MSDSTKRAERRENEFKHWERRLKREFYGNTNNKECDCVNVKTFDEFKNTKCGEKLKNTNNLDDKNRWKDAIIKNSHKKDRFLSKIEIDNSIIEYNNENNKLSNSLKMDYLRDNLKRCNNDISEIEELLRELPERLEVLMEMKREIEEEICWLQLDK